MSESKQQTKKPYHMIFNDPKIFEAIEKYVKKNDVGSIRIFIEKACAEKLKKEGVKI